MQLAMREKNEPILSLEPPFLSSGQSIAHLTSKGPLTHIPQTHDLLSYALPQMNTK